MFRNSHAFSGFSTNDIAKAKQLLATAGAGSVSVTLTTEQFLEIPQYAQFIKQMLEPAGFKVALDIQPQTKFYGTGANQPWLQVPFGITDWGARGTAGQTIDPAYLSAEEDVRVLLDGVRLARRLLATSALAPHVRAELLPGPAAQSDEELVQVLRAKAHTLYHPVGTCALGTVVDPELRVRGVGGLRVADASVIPRIPRGHTNWPTVMIAEKAADLLRGHD